MAIVRSPFLKPERARGAAEQLAWFEVDALRRRSGLAARIGFDFGNGVSGIGFRIAVDRIVIENDNDL